MFYCYISLTPRHKLTMFQQRNRSKIQSCTGNMERRSSWNIDPSYISLCFLVPVSLDTGTHYSCHHVLYLTVIITKYRIYDKHFVYLSSLLSNIIEFGLRTGISHFYCMVLIHVQISLTSLNLKNCSSYLIPH